MNKKAQEEIVGFVLIVILVSVIVVVLLGISLRKNTTESIQSNEIESFISSVSYYTTDCQKYETNFRTIEQLVEDCYENDICLDKTMSCQVLEDTLKDILEHSTYIVNENSRTYYYELKVYTGAEESTAIPLIKPISKTSRNIEIGKCPGALMYNNKEFNTFGEEKIIMKLSVCYNK